MGVFDYNCNSGDTGYYRFCSGPPPEEDEASGAGCIYVKPCDVNGTYNLVKNSQNYFNWIEDTFTINENLTSKTMVVNFNTPEINFPDTSFPFGGGTIPGYTIPAMNDTFAITLTYNEENCRFEVTSGVYSDTNNPIPQNRLEELQMDYFVKENTTN